MGSPDVKRTVFTIYFIRLVISSTRALETIKFARKRHNDSVYSPLARLSRSFRFCGFRSLISDWEDSAASRTNIKLRVLRAGGVGGVLRGGEKCPDAGWA